MEPDTEYLRWIRDMIRYRRFPAETGLFGFMIGLSGQTNSDYPILRQLTDVAQPKTGLDTTYFRKLTSRTHTTITLTPHPSPCGGCMRMTTTIATVLRRSSSGTSGGRRRPHPCHRALPLRLHGRSHRRRRPWRFWVVNSNNFSRRAMRGAFNPHRTTTGSRRRRGNQPSPLRLNHHNGKWKR